jgi:hypothetical protein
MSSLYRQGRGRLKGTPIGGCRRCEEIVRLLLASRQLVNEKDGDEQTMLQVEFTNELEELKFAESGISMDKVECTMRRCWRPQLKAMRRLSSCCSARVPTSTLNVNIMLMRCRRRPVEATSRQSSYSSARASILTLKVDIMATRRRRHHLEIPKSDTHPTIGLGHEENHPRQPLIRDSRH